MHTYYHFRCDRTTIPTYLAFWIKNMFSKIHLYLDAAFFSSTLRMCQKLFFVRKLNLHLCKTALPFDSKTRCEHFSNKVNENNICKGHDAVCSVYKYSYNGPILHSAWLSPYRRLPCSVANQTSITLTLMLTHLTHVAVTLTDNARMFFRKQNTYITQVTRQSMCKLFNGVSEGVRVLYTCNLTYMSLCYLHTAFFNSGCHKRYTVRDGTLCCQNNKFYMLIDKEFSVLVYNCFLNVLA